MARNIVTDSTAYLDEEYIRKHKIRVVPLYVHLDDAVFKEGSGMSHRAYYQLMRTRPIFPRTSQPSAGDFLEIYKEARSDDELLVLTISSALSGTEQSAYAALQILDEPHARIEIFDSRLTAAALAMMIYKAQRMLDDLLPTGMILQHLVNLPELTRTYFVVDNLEYLKRSGRIGSWAKMLADAFQIKPVLQLKNGEIELYQKIRTRHKALAHIVELIAKEAENIEQLYVMHVDCTEEAEKLAGQIRTVYKGAINLMEVGPVIGSHVGPGGLGAAWITGDAYREMPLRHTI